MKIWIFIFMLLYVGCSTKQSNNILKSKIQQKQIHKINIAKNGKFLFYAYLKDGNKLTRISKRKLKTFEDEEIIKVYSNGYYPLYHIPNKHFLCGTGLVAHGIGKNKKGGYEYTFNNGNQTEQRPLLCNSHYISTNIGKNILRKVILLGAPLEGSILLKNFDKEKFKEAILESGLNSLKNRLNINNGLFIIHKVYDIGRNIKLSEVDNLNISGIILMDNDNNLIGSVKLNDLKQKNIFEATSILTQRLVNSYLKVKKPMDISLLIPPKIPKPKLPPIPKLIKSEFETQKMFNDRVKQARLKREEKIKTLQSIFRHQVEERNKKIDELKKLHQKDLAQIELEEKAKRENIEKYMPYFTSIAMKYLVGNLALKDLRYDAENQLMYANLKSSNPNYHKKIYLKVPLDKAQIFKSKKDYTPIVTYEYNKDKLTLKEIKVDNYYAKLTQTDYQPKQIEVKLKDKEINTHYAQNDLYLQNPNLKDIVVSDSIIIEGEDKTIADFKDDIPQLLQSVNQTSQDPKKWLFVIGAEEYDNTDNVIYSKRSAETFATVAKKTLGITERNSYLFLGDRATSGAIEDNLNRMLENVNEGDSIYFYYSGHGIPVLPDRTPYILPKDKIPDYISRSPFFKLNNIYNLLSNSKANKIIAVIDSCFSGSTDGKSVFKGVASVVLAPKKVTFNHNKMVVITAGRAKQFSNMYPKRGHRLFSYFLIKSLLEGKRNIGDINSSIYPNVKRVSNGFGDLKRQEPTIEGNEKLSF